MKYIDIRDLSDKELYRTLKEKRDELRVLRFKVASGQLKEVKKINETKITIARILTALRKKQVKQLDK